MDGAPSHLQTAASLPTIRIISFLCSPGIEVQRNAPTRHLRVRYRWSSRFAYR